MKERAAFLLGGPSVSVWDAFSLWRLVSLNRRGGAWHAGPGQMKVIGSPGLYFLTFSFMFCCCAWYAHVWRYHGPTSCETEPVHRGEESWLAARHGQRMRVFVLPLNLTCLQWSLVSSIRVSLPLGASQGLRLLLSPMSHPTLPTITTSIFLFSQLIPLHSWTAVFRNQRR